MLFHAIYRFFIVLLVIYAVLSRIVGANIFGPFLYLCYFNRFFHLCPTAPTEPTESILPQQIQQHPLFMGAVATVTTHQ